jgi:hypothetical protein
MDTTAIDELNNVLHLRSYLDGGASAGPSDFAKFNVLQLCPNVIRLVGYPSYHIQSNNHAHQP